MDLWETPWIIAGNWQETIDEAFATVRWEMIMI